MKKKNLFYAFCKKHGVVFALLALILAAALLFPEFASYGNVTNILNQNSMIGIISLWYDLCYFDGRHRPFSWFACGAVQCSGGSPKPKG